MTQRTILLKMNLHGFDNFGGNGSLVYALIQTRSKGFYV